MLRFLCGAFVGMGVSSSREKSNAVSLGPPQLNTSGGSLPASSSSGTPETKGPDFDLLVIGGGSGGLAAAKRASDLGARVCVCDWVDPSETRGTVWGLGGTCVNVGCIPKKLMHFSAQLGFQNTYAAEAFGWRLKGGVGSLPPLECDWATLRSNVTDHVRSLNFGNMVVLRDKNIYYKNAKAFFGPRDEGDAHLSGAQTVTCVDRKGNHSLVTAGKVLVAVGGRPTLPSIEGAKEHCITSDDLFNLPTDPGRTLVIGGGYVALECAGLLHGIGKDVSVMVRSVPLRGFDTDMVSKVVGFMERLGIRFFKGEAPVRITKSPNGKLTVEGTIGLHENFDTVLLALGRRPATAALRLDNAGVSVKLDGKIVVDPITHQTSNPSVYAVGDAAAGGPELTPLAIRDGRAFADRAFGKQNRVADVAGSCVKGRNFVPTTVFTPLEYGCVGMTEEAAIAALGSSAVEVFHSDIIPTEWTVPHLETSACYVKMIVEKATDLVLGFHIVSPNAGEITQGVAVALNVGARKSDFDSTLGIHPTVAEEMTRLSITKSSGLSPSKSGC